MNAKTLTVLGVAAAAVAGGVLLVELRGGSGGEAAATAAGQRFVPVLQARANDVALVRVSNASNTLTFRRGETGWGWVEKGGYPVQFDKVRAAILSVAELRAIEPKTSKPELYEKLGVQDPGTAAAAESEDMFAAPPAPVLLTLKDDQEQTLASVIVGNQKWDAKPGVYVRKEGEAQSWYAQGQLDVSTNLASWVDTKIIDLSRDRIRHVAVAHPDGETVTASRQTPAAVNFTVHDLPAGKELKSPSSGDAMGTALAWVNFEDVAPNRTFDFLAGKAGTTSEYRTFDGLVIAVQLVEHADGAWAQFRVSFDDTVTPVTGPGIKSLEEARQEAKELSDRLSPWFFRLPGYKVIAFNSRMAEMLKDAPPAMPASMEGVEMLDPGLLIKPPPSIALPEGK
jgi:hypothetical protein